MNNIFFYQCDLVPIQIRIENISIHPRYSRRTITNDIALIRLATPARMSRNVQLVCLPLDEAKIASEFEASITKRLSVFTLS